jgi:hypothetical protein
MRSILLEFPILSAQELYTREEEYEQSIDPTWHSEMWKIDDEYEITKLSAALGEAQGPAQGGAGGILAGGGFSDGGFPAPAQPLACV